MFFQHSSSLATRHSSTSSHVYQFCKCISRKTFCPLSYALLNNISAALLHYQNCSRPSLIRTHRAHYLFEYAKYQICTIMNLIKMYTSLTSSSSFACRISFLPVLMPWVSKFETNSGILLSLDQRWRTVVSKDRTTLFSVPFLARTPEKSSGSILRVVQGMHESHKCSLTEYMRV